MGNFPPPRWISRVYPRRQKGARAQACEHSFSRPLDYSRFIYMRENEHAAFIPKGKLIAPLVAKFARILAKNPRNLV
jgi:hypothetical protein